MKKQDAVIAIQILLSVLLIWVLVLSLQLIKLNNQVLDALASQSQINQFQNDMLEDLGSGYRAVMIHQAGMANALGFSREIYVSATTTD